MQTFIIEHCDTQVYQWSLIEYGHISSFVGTNNLWFTHTGSKRLESLGKVIKKSFTDLNLKNAVILDPSAKKTLTPSEKFDYFIFGGILGDHPPTKRTQAFLSKKSSLPTRNLGSVQMSTDNAVYVTKMIIEGTPFSKIPFKDNINIPIKKGEEVHLPYRYVLVSGKPLIHKDIIKKLKEGRSF